MGVATHSRNTLWKNFFIKQFIKLYNVDMAEAITADIKDYPCFNSFFTRALKKDVRPVDNEPNSIVCPADGTINQAGNIADNQLIQAKDKYYNLSNLLGNDANRALPFLNGKFATVYLAPKDYHRLHMPFSGKLQEMVHIPGRLFSVNQATTQVVNNLFGRNERVVAIFETSTGLMALVLVGAIFVASIETVWQGEVTPPTRSSPHVWNYSSQSIELKKGEEMGRFNMGSTIIVLFGQNQIEWSESLEPGQEIKLGQSIGRLMP